MSTTHPRERYTNIVQESEVDGGFCGRLRVVRVSPNGGKEFVFVDSDLLGARRLTLTPEQAADFAEALHNVSGMATSTYAAQDLAPVVRDSLARQGITQLRAAAGAGISRYRLRRILSAEVPMTTGELKALSSLGTTL